MPWCCDRKYTVTNGLSVCGTVRQRLWRTAEHCEKTCWLPFESCRHDVVGIEHRRKVRPDSVEAFMVAPTAAASNDVLRTVISFTASFDFTVWTALPAHRRNPDNITITCAKNIDLKWQQINSKKCKRQLHALCTCAQWTEHTEVSSKKESTISVLAKNLAQPGTEAKTWRGQVRVRIKVSMVRVRVVIVRNKVTIWVAASSG